MSSNTALRQRPALRVQTSADKQRSPQLRVIEGLSPQRARIPMLIIGLVVVILSVAVPLILQTRMAHTAFEIRKYQLELNAVNAQTWTIQTELRAAESAISLEKKARAIGMVPAQVSGTISLSNGVVDGGVASR